MSKSLLPNDERTKIKEIVGTLTCKVLPAMKRLHVRRKTIWKDYVDYRKKKVGKQKQFSNIGICWGTSSG